MFYKTLRFICRIFFYIFIGKTKIIGKENITAANEGAVIVCANHMSNWDPIILIDVFPRQIFFMGKKALFDNPLEAWLMRKMGVFPVDKEAVDVTAVKNALKVLKGGNTLGIFPEGRRNKDGYVHEFKDGTSMFAHKTKAKVIPVGIKREIGLFKRPIVEVGAVVDYSEFYDKKGTNELYREMNEVLRREISRLASGEGIRNIYEEDNTCR